MLTSHLLYLHGFRSSPQSAKARSMAALIQQQYPDVTWWCPQLPPSPQAAIKLIEDGLTEWRKGAGFESMAVMGSSLGGFYATYIAEKTGCNAVLLNPAVNPARDLANYIGEQSVWHNADEKIFFEPTYIDELRALECGSLKVPQNYFTIVAKGDEVLDWREMSTRYARTHLNLLEGGDHGLSNFDDHVPAILAFLNLK